MTQAVAALEQWRRWGSVRSGSARCDREELYGRQQDARAAVYIGDGSSRANLLTPEQLDKAVNNLVVEHIPMTTFGIGAGIDGQVLGTRPLHGRAAWRCMIRSACLPMRSGQSCRRGSRHGRLAEGRRHQRAGRCGDLSQAAAADGSDRETVLVGSTKAALPKQLDISLGDGQKLLWDVPELKSDAKNGYLVSLVDQAKVDGGRTLPLVDADSLTNAKNEIEAGGQGLNRLAEMALSGGQFDKAEQLADEALRRNPNDVR